MDLTSKIALEQYFEEGRDFYNCFVVLRGDKLVEPVVEGSFIEEIPASIKIEDKFDIYEGDVLIYPKTRQYCIIDDIRHIAEKGYYLIHYHTKYNLKYVPRAKE